MAQDAKTAVRDAIIEQMNAFIEVMSKMGVTSVYNEFLTDDGFSGIQDPVVTTASGGAIDLNLPCPRGTFFLTCLTRAGEVRAYKDQDAETLHQAQEQVFENLSEFFYEVGTTGEFEIVNTIKMAIDCTKTGSEAVTLTIDVSETEDPMWRRWSLETMSGQDIYVIADNEGSFWGHLFDGDLTAVGAQIERTCRWIYDREKEEFLKMEVLGDDGCWTPLGRATSADLSESLKDFNEDVLLRPESYGLRQSGKLPAWAEPTPSEAPEL